MRSSSSARSREPVGVRSSTFTRRSVGRRPAAHEPARFQPVHQPGHVRRVAGERLGELPHRDRPAGLDQVQHMALRRRKLELRGQRRQVRPLGEEEPHQQLPGVAGVGLAGFIA